MRYGTLRYVTLHYHTVVPYGTVCAECLPCAVVALRTSRRVPPNFAARREPPLYSRSCYTGQPGLLRALHRCVAYTRRTHSARASPDQSKTKEYPRDPTNQTGRSTLTPSSQYE